MELTTKEKYEAVLNVFSGKGDPFRPDFHQPFIQDVKYISTNAHVLCSLPVSVAELNFKPQETPKCASVLIYEKPFSRKISVQELKDVVEKFGKKIPEYKYPPQECNECDGEGYLECDLGHDHDCERCDGTGEMEGKEPTGKMITDQYSILGIWGSYIMILNLNKLFEACDILSVTEIEELSAGISNKYTFKVGDFEILIMGCFNKEEEAVETDLVNQPTNNINRQTMNTLKVVIEVEDGGPLGFALKINDQGAKLFIDKKFCTVLQSDIQPEQWFPKVGEFVIAFANPIRREFWGHTGKCIISEERDYVFEFNKEEQVDSMLSGVRKALPNEIPAPEPKGYCIKRTPENAEVLNKWANKQFVSGYDYSVNEWFILSKPLCMEYKNLTSGTIPEGFKELFTVEEFFAKVGYTPEPKLIAKAGEFIKLVSTKGEHALKVNMPVKLISNYKEGGYIQLNGYSYTAEFIEKNSMKFELCPAPVSEPVQVDTPIERIENPIDKVTIERLDLVLRMCNIQLHATLIDKIIDCVELIEQKGEEVNLKDIRKMQAEWKSSQK